MHLPADCTLGHPAAASNAQAPAPAPVRPTYSQAAMTAMMYEDSVCWVCLWASACKHIFLLLYALHSNNSLLAVLFASVFETLFWLLLPVILNFLVSVGPQRALRPVKYVKRAKCAPPYYRNAYLVRLCIQVVSGTQSVLSKMASWLAIVSNSKVRHKRNKPPNRNRRKKSSRNFRLRYVSRAGFRKRFLHRKSELQKQHKVDATLDIRYECSRKGSFNSQKICKWYRWFSKKNNTTYKAFQTSYDDRISRMAVFDTDAFSIIVDSGCSRTLSSFKGDFIESSLKPRAGSTRSVQGFSGSLTTIEATGTILWNIMDDSGELRELRIPNCLYVPKSNTRLLSPQHLAQDSSDIVMYVVKAKEAVLSWESTKATNDDKLLATKTMTIDRESANIATLWAAHGFQRYKAFEARIPKSDIQPDMHLDKGSLMELADKLREESYKIEVDTDFWKANLRTPIPDPLEETYLNIKRPEDAKLLWHQRLGHVSMERIDRLSNLGYLPAFLAKCPHPICQACIYGKMTRRPWRTKPTLDDEISNTSTAVGSTISVDQLESPILGFYAQLKGRLTKSRYRVATIFVDHHSDYSYVFLQQSTTSKETVEAKHAFEQHAKTFGVDILHYHADNGRFADNLWRDDVAKQGQKLTFSGVGAHHQNGRAEKRIRDLQDLARTSLIQANRMWPDAINSNLWPYALRHSNDSINCTHFKGKDLTPIEIFSGSDVIPNVSQTHPFGCPAYALDGAVQGGQKAPKWNTRARMAIYLGASPQHASTVGLLMSLTTGLVSPQFHVRYDDTFQTLRKPSYVVPSLWQRLAGFKKTKKIPKGANDDPIAVIPNNENRDQNTTRQVNINDDPIFQQADVQPAYEDIGEIDQQMEIPEVLNIIHPPPYPQGQEVHVPQTTRSGRVSVPPRRYEDYVAFSANVTEPEGDLDILELAFAAIQTPTCCIFTKHLRLQIAKNL